MTLNGVLLKVTNFVLDYCTTADLSVLSVLCTKLYIGTMTQYYIFALKRILVLLAIVEVSGKK